MIPFQTKYLLSNMFSEHGGISKYFFARLYAFKSKLNIYLNEKMIIFVLKT
jgi:hypothetical protein